MSRRIGIYIAAGLTVIVGLFALGCAKIAFDALMYDASGEDVEFAAALSAARVVFCVFTVVFAGIFLMGSWWIRGRWREERWTDRERQGRCGRCGYDVRGVRHCCPECGFPINLAVPNRTDQ